MTEAGKGILAMLAAATLWGVSAIFFKALAHVPPLEMLAHRSLWSVVFFGLVLAAQGRLAEIVRVLRAGSDRGKVIGAAVFIACNWFLFIWAVQRGEAMQGSLGYFIFPLMAVLAGRLLLGERQSIAKWAAVAIAAGAVGLLAWGLDTAPWLALAISTSFTIYGLIKRGVPAGPVVSVSAEALLLLPVALAWLAAVHLRGWVGLGTGPGALFGTGWHDTLLLIASGPVTALPLVLFSYATRRLPYATIGLVGYLNPTLQFLVAALVFAEPLTRWHAIAFPVIWAALALYTAESLRQERSARRRTASSSTPPTGMT